jgi:hypothetical protein
LPDAGAAHVFDLDESGARSPYLYLKASNPGAEDHFGVSLAVTDGMFVVGAAGEDSLSTVIGGEQLDDGDGVGAVYGFR